jgi:hypothetical protein
MKICHTAAQDTANLNLYSAERLLDEVKIKVVVVMMIRNLL